MDINDLKIQLLNSRIIDKNNCWNWIKIRDRHGYGIINIDCKRMLVHRLMFILMNGDIPKGICICHRCDNPSCFNPDHLFAGTQKDNLADMTSKGRRGTSNQKGEHNGNCRLTEAQVIYIHKLKAKGLSQMTIGKQLGISHTQVWRIVHGYRWSNMKQHLEEVLG